MSLQTPPTASPSDTPRRQPAPTPDHRLSRRNGASSRALEGARYAPHSHCISNEAGGNHTSSLEAESLITPNPLSSPRHTILEQSSSVNAADIVNWPNQTRSIDMPFYCVNTVAQSGSGDHEVHDLNSRHGCLPAEAHRLDLGFFGSCQGAVLAAKRHYPKSNGCAWCARECNTG